MTVAYNGAAFHGFARQEGLPTVQGELESALATLLRREVPTTGAGRTDTGVHAHGQVVSFPIAPDELAPRSLRKLQTSLNALTCNDLVIRDVTEKPAGFSARFSAIEREYRYRLYTREAPPLFLAPFVWWVPRDKNTPLDITAMKQAASLLIGEHDFASFCVAKSAEGIRTMRELKEIFIFGIQHLGEPCIVIQVRGNAFLHSMVRVIVGSLVEVGKRNRPPEWLGEVLAARDRRAAGQTAPAQGLTLWQVRYPQQ